MAARKIVKICEASSDRFDFLCEMFSFSLRKRLGKVYRHLGDSCSHVLSR